MKYYKLTNKKEIHHGLKYQDGLNEDKLPWNPDADCEPGGIYFSDTENILKYLGNNFYIREVTLTEDVLFSSGDTKYKANKVILGKRKALNKLSTWKWMVEEGINIHTDDDFALRYSSRNGHLEVVRYLVEQGSDIHIWDDFALRLASENGHLEVVKYLVEKGANIHAVNDAALRWASNNGHTDVVEYLKGLL